jgi:hypothetical protein
MKTFSLLLALSLVGPAALAQSTNVADRVTDVSCDYPNADLGGLNSIFKSDGGIGMVAGWVDANNEIKASAYTLTYAALAAGDQDGLTLMATGPDGDLDLILDTEGKAQFYQLNGSVEKTKGLTCKVSFKEAKK